MSNTVALNFAPNEAKSIVKIYRSNLDPSGIMRYGRIKRHKVTADTLIARSLKTKENISSIDLMRDMAVIKTQIVQSLLKGEAVDLFDLGTLYLVPNGRCDQTGFTVNPCKPCTVRFSPSKQLREQLSDMRFEDVVVEEVSAHIDCVHNCNTGEDNATVTSEGVVRLSGERIKVQHNEIAQGGVFFAPVDASGKACKDERQWQAVQSVFRNQPCELELICPQLVAGQSYRIIVRTFYSGTSRPLSRVREAVSAVVRVDSG